MSNASELFCRIDGKKFFVLRKMTKNQVQRLHSNAFLIFPKEKTLP